MLAVIISGFSGGLITKLSAWLTTIKLAHEIASLSYLFYLSIPFHFPCPSDRYHFWLYSIRSFAASLDYFLALSSCFQIFFSPFISCWCRGGRHVLWQDIAPLRSPARKAKSSFWPSHIFVFFFYSAHYNSASKPWFLRYTEPPSISRPLPPLSCMVDETRWKLDSERKLAATRRVAMTPYLHSINIQILSCPCCTCNVLHVSLKTYWFHVTN